MVHILTESLSRVPPPLPINIPFVIIQHPCGSNCNCLRGKVVLGGVCLVFFVCLFVFNSPWCDMIVEKNLNISFCYAFKTLSCQLRFCAPCAVPFHRLLICLAFLQAVLPPAPSLSLSGTYCSCFRGSAVSRLISGSLCQDGTCFSSLPLFRK